MRGEHGAAPSSSEGRAGSSPRARGTLVRCRQRTRLGRFIPACAGNTSSLDRSIPVTSVHPRVRGEHADTSTQRRCANGSSPRARGTLFIVLPLFFSVRFIPACAGNTSLTTPTPLARTVHPRVRGEHRCTTTATCPTPGSSPRARGTRGHRGRGHRDGRFIPACAGNTAWCSRGNSYRAVHPRVRGEHAAVRELHSPPNGSSPRARGTPDPRRTARRRGRFIPACAGNTIVNVDHGRRGAVHPRVRGEHEGYEAWLYAQRGSSPRARGTHDVSPGVSRLERFIPACAGNTSAGTRRRAATPVHPRVRGEHSCPCATPTCRGGSSPRARGTHFDRPHALGSLRFIPACAGNTRARPSRAWRHPVHPRVRGEHTENPSSLALQAGSSPRARGTHRIPPEEAGQNRFIPACAGNTYSPPSSSTT